MWCVCVHVHQCVVCVCVYVYDSFLSLDPHWPGKVSSVVGNMGPCGPADLHLHSMAGLHGGMSTID